MQATGDRCHPAGAATDAGARAALSGRPSLVRAIVADGCEKARKLAQDTMRDVREADGAGLLSSGKSDRTAQPGSPFFYVRFHL
jgi:hypothetical protein